MYSQTWLPWYRLSNGLLIGVALRTLPAFADFVIADTKEARFGYTESKDLVLSPAIGICLLNQEDR